MADIAARNTAILEGNRRGGLHKLMQRKSTIAFLMALPLIVLLAVLVAYPAGYAIWLATLSKSMTKFVGFGNFEFLFKRATFWDIVFQSCLFAITAVLFKAIIGFVVAHFVHNIPTKGQRKWRGTLTKGVSWRGSAVILAAALGKGALGIIGSFSRNSVARSHPKATTYLRAATGTCVLRAHSRAHEWPSGAGRPQPSGEPSAFVSTGSFPTRHPGARRRHGLYR